MKIRFLSIVFAILNFVTSVNANAALLFDGGAPYGLGGLRITEDISPGGITSVPVSDFITDGVWNINDVEFWTSEHNELFVWNGELQYWFFNDNGGAPDGSPVDNYVATGFGQLITKTMLGPNPNNTTGYNYTFSLEQPVILPSDSRYWLGLKLGVDDPTVDNNEAYWQETITGFGSNSYLFVQDPSMSTQRWLEFQIDLAFQLKGSVVPIPPSAWLFGTGLLGLIGIARRKQAA